MAGIVSGIPIVSTVTRNRIHKNCVLAKLFKLDIEKTSALPVHQRDPQSRVFRKNGDQWFQMKAAVNKKLGGARHRGKIKFVPYATRAARENGFGPRLVAVQPF